MSFTPDGTNSPLYSGANEPGPFPAQGEDLDADQDGSHLKKITEAIDAIILRLGLTTDTDGTAWGSDATVAERFANLGAGATDHGGLTGLTDDDHDTGVNAYHTDTRGDIRYYRKGQLDAGQLDTRYFTEAEHVETLVVPTPGLPVKTHFSTGKIFHSLLPDNILSTSAFFPVMNPDDQIFRYQTKSVTGNQGAVLNFQVPSDQDLPSRVDLVFIPTFTGIDLIDVDTSFGGVGEAANVHTENAVGLQLNFTANEIFEADIKSSAFTLGLSPSDYAGIEITPNGPWGGTVHILGVNFIYRPLAPYT